MIKFLMVEHDGYLDEFIFKKAVDKGVELYLVTNSLEDWILRYVKYENIIKADTDDHVNLITTVKNHTVQNQVVFDGTGTFFERFVVNTARLAHALELIHVPLVASLQSSCDKFNMRTVCKKANIPQPNFDLVKLGEEEKINNFLNLNKVAVLKPISGSGSIGVHKLDANSDFNAIKNDIQNQIDDEDNNYVISNRDLFLIEEYVPGGLISVDGLVQDNIAYFIGETEFFLGQEPRFIQEGGITPTISYSEIQIANTKDLVRNIIKVLGFNNCGFHCEMRMTKKGPILLEIAARAPGGPILSNYEKAHGIDGISLMLDIWLGKKIEISKNKYNYLIHKDVFAQKSGKIKLIEIPESIKHKEGLNEIIVFAKPNDAVSDYSLHPKIIYYYSVISKGKNSVQQLAKEVEGSIIVKIES